MSCSGKECKTNKWCGWLQSISQLLVATIIVLAGLVVNHHMESWTIAFQQGSKDLHNISMTMDKITKDMEVIKMQMHDMNYNTSQINYHFDTMNRQMYHMNGNMNNIRTKMSPQGMMKSFMPFP